ncbi:RING finger protein 121/175 [Nematocida homosporus]|uniref:RING finger protein 121/175 n=1 Tax=Nematocida homosporus TaxID=1912981 RepID=UPI00221EE5AB|nr:RING finger protein 121/175 [Nematocida homosporus]KAI5186308.1 RING finger protein 121/175 [Nematocida homosporus]
MAHTKSLGKAAQPEEAPIVIRNVRGVTRRTNVQEIDEGLLVQELLVVEVDRGEGAMLNSLVALAIVFVAVHIVSFLWKKYYTRSFLVCSTVVLLFFPLVTAVVSRSFVFVGLWAALALVHLVGYKEIWLGRRPKIIGTNIYRVYRHAFRLSILLSSIGYGLLAYGFFFGPMNYAGRGVLLLMYVLYFTLVSRIGLEYVSYRAAGTILPSKSVKKAGVCPLCSEAQGKLIALSCKETFHEECLKNWKILGKKDTCPSCKERVDLSEISMNPIQKNEYFFTQFLDFTGNLILAYAVTQGLVFFFHL